MMEAHDYLSSVKTDYDVISIRDSCYIGREFFCDADWISNSSSLLPLYFDSITESEAEKFPDLAMIPPSLVHVKKVKAFFNQNTDGNYLIHCFAGHSRSSSVAIFISYLHNHDPQKAINVLNKKKHSPNMTFMKYAAELENAPQLYQVTEQWSKDI